MRGRPRTGAGVKSLVWDRGHTPTAPGEPSLPQKAGTVGVRPSHGPPEWGRHSGGEEWCGDPRAGPAPGFPCEKWYTRAGGPAPDQRRGQRRLPV